MAQYKGTMGFGLSITISVIALIISLITLYLTYLEPPKIQVSVSSPTWLGTLNTQDAIALKLTCVISNLGSRNGVVEDVVLIVESEEKKKTFLFSPVVVVDDHTFYQTRATSKQWVSGVFRPVPVSPHESIVITLLFHPETNNPTFPFDSLSPGTYRISVRTRRSGDTGWKQHQVFTVLFTQQTINNMK